MNKIGLIIQREYLQIVRKKSFLITTILMPILMVAIITVPAIFSAKQFGRQASNEKKDWSEQHSRQVVVLDKSGLYKDAFAETKSVTYTHDPEASPGDFKNQTDICAVIEINNNLAPADSQIKLYAQKKDASDLEIRNALAALQKYVINQRITDSPIPNLQQVMNDATAHVKVDPQFWEEPLPTTDDNATGSPVNEKVKKGLAMVAGTLSTVMIYMFLIIYGMQVMRCVTQEKITRVVEVVASSVRPFDLMTGKIIGIGLVGLTQVAIWALLILLLQNLLPATPLSGRFSEMMAILSPQLKEIHFTTLAICFIIYFIGGYLLYASFFAAIGSAIDNETDSQQFVTPVTLILVFALYVGIFGGAGPEGPLPFWCSMIPLTSPVVMLTRIPYGVPLWELVASITILYSSFILSTMLAARIYRVGILMYGKKPSWRELAKWISYKQ